MIDRLINWGSWQDGNEVFFRIKRATQLRKLMNAYCDRQSVDLQSIAFLFDGRRLRGEQTPDEASQRDASSLYSSFLRYCPVGDFLSLAFISLTCSWKWRMGMRSTPCSTKPAAVSESCRRLQSSLASLPFDCGAPLGPVNM